MQLQQLINTTVFQIGNYQVTISILLWALLSVIVVLVLRYFCLFRLLPRVLVNQDIPKQDVNRLKRSFYLTLFLLLLIFLWYSSGVDFNFKTLELEQLFLSEVDPNAVDQAPNSVSTENYIELTVRTLLLSVFTWQLAQFLILLFDVVSIDKYLVHTRLHSRKRSVQKKAGAEDQQRASRNFKYFIRTFAILLIISILHIDFKLFSFTINNNDFTLRVSNVISAVLIILLARLIIWMTIRVFLTRIYANQEVDSGSQFAINQLFQYIIYFISLLIVLNVMGVNPTVLAGSAAALLLGVGLGLQQTFNDFFSGILLLFERSVEIGDVVEVGGLTGSVRRIGLRTSQV